MATITQDPTIAILTERREAILQSLDSDTVTMSEALAAFDELADIEAAIGYDKPVSRNPHVADFLADVADAMAEEGYQTPYQIRASVGV